MKTVVDSQRGCGWRKPGGLYLRTEPGLLSPCGKLPLPLDVCPCCGAGVKFTRGWTWVSPALLFKGAECKAAACGACTLRKPPERAGLLWIGAAYYTKEEWVAEAEKMGVSRRVHTLPKGFKVGKDWVLVAHRQGVATGERDEKGNAVWKPAIFHMFQPTEVEYVVKGSETPEQLKRLEDRGITPVKVRRDGDLPLELNEDGSQKQEPKPAEPEPTKAKKALRKRKAKKS